MSAVSPSGNDIEITSAATADALADGSATVVDIREPHEREAGHIPGTTWIPLGELQARAGEIPQDRPVVFTCFSGGRSLMAAQAFRAAGYDARSHAGGISAWDAEGRPIAPEGGRVAH